MDQTSPKKDQKPPGPRFSFSKLFKITFIGLLLYPAFLYGQQALQKFVGRVYFDTHLVHELDDYEKFKQKFKRVGNYSDKHYNWPTWYNLSDFPPDRSHGKAKVRRVMIVLGLRPIPNCGYMVDTRMINGSNIVWRHVAMFFVHLNRKTSSSWTMMICHLRIWEDVTKS